MQIIQLVYKPRAVGRNRKKYSQALTREEKMNRLHKSAARQRCMRQWAYLVLKERALVVRLIGVCLFIAIMPLAAQTPKFLPQLREQAAIQQEWLKLRLERVLPTLMRRYGVQMWLVICREYNEDPVFFSLISATQFAARRRTIYVFFDRGEKDGIERLALGGGGQAGLYTVYRDPEVENRELWGQGQWALLKKLIEDRQPKTIAINISHTHAFSDGLSAGEYEQLTDALGEKWKSRFVRAGRAIKCDTG